MKNIVLKGVGASPGVAIGRAYIYDRYESQISYYNLTSPQMVEKEVRRFRRAVRAAEMELKGLAKRLKTIDEPTPVYIINVHLMILRDRSFVEGVIRRIREEAVNAEWAVRVTVDYFRRIFERMENEYLRERFNDIRYVGQLVLRHLEGKVNKAVFQPEERVIVIASDLSPADTAQMMVDHVLGFATDIGSRTSHTAIVARSLGIPAVVGLERITQSVRTNDIVVVDGMAGVVIVDPDPEVKHRYEEKNRLYLEDRTECMKYAHQPAITKDEYRVRIGGNIEFVEEIPQAVSYGAEGIGLYRTEFIYINKEQLPTEEEHFSIYRRVVESEGLSWATIRTFDLGGDKFFSDPKLAKEMNPQMGLRAIRFCLKEVDLFKVQLRAILRASAFGKTKILFPMISGVEEIREAKRILASVRADLEREGVPVGEEVEVGIMIEVPSAVLVAEALAQEADFFSIGTNDLIQYALAIDRINERVNYLYEPLHPAVIRMIKHVVDVGHHMGIPVAMCGEMAGEPLYTMILLGLDLDELSMNPLAIPKMKMLIQQSSRAEARRIVQRILRMTSAEEVRKYVTDYMLKHYPERWVCEAD
ncbi:MAG: phosphoenolpyruvate--protein phosphotransferase [Syntrophales bacterium]|nr:phosphoenolpyruvate--protein phosphotransferase [Syntrophales bacterium]